MTPHWDDMRIFLAVARAESLSGAGRLLRIDPATVGRRVARLEEALGAPLFAKSPTGYALSEAGARLMEHAIRAEQAMEAAAHDLAGQAGGLAGQIRIGAPDGCANFVLPQVCAAIAADNPDLEIQIVLQFRQSGAPERSHLMRCEDHRVPHGARARIAEPAFVAHAAEIE